MLLIEKFKIIIYLQFYMIKNLITKEGLRMLQLWYARVNEDAADT